MTPPSPHLHSIWTTPSAGGAPERRGSVLAIAGRGLSGDRYAAGVGSFSARDNGNAREVTLIAIEDVDGFARETSFRGSPGELRRNLVTSGLDLRELEGAVLAIGHVRLEIAGTCPPCGLLDRYLAIPARTSLRERGGMRARITVGGELVEGDPIQIERAPRRLP